MYSKSKRKSSPDSSIATAANTHRIGHIDEKLLDNVMRWRQSCKLICVVQLKAVARIEKTKPKWASEVLSAEYSGELVGTGATVSTDRHLDRRNSPPEAMMDVLCLATWGVAMISERLMRSRH